MWQLKDWHICHIFDTFDRCESCYIYYRCEPVECVTVVRVVTFVTVTTGSNREIILQCEHKICDSYDNCDSCDSWGSCKRDEGWWQGSNIVFSGWKLLPLWLLWRLYELCYFWHLWKADMQKEQICLGTMIWGGDSDEMWSCVFMNQLWPLWHLYELWQLWL